MRVIWLPDKVMALVSVDSDGNFNIYVDEKLPKNIQEMAVQHELQHIRKEHFYDELKPIQIIEKEAGER